MSADNPLTIHVDRSAFSVVTKEEAQKQDIEFWLSKTPHERLEALESLWQIAYGTIQLRSDFKDFLKLLNDNKV